MKSIACIIIFGCFLASVISPPICSGDEGKETIFPQGYRTYVSMTNELKNLHAVYPKITRIISLGKTYEGRDIWAFKISDDAAKEDVLEPKILYIGCHHAREIMSVELPMYLINYLLKNYGKNRTINEYVNTEEIWFVPMLNPDGHVYVEMGNDWRKNRRPIDKDNDGRIDGIGVDLNRNYGFKFGVDSATSDNPQSEVYHGPYPFSENETKFLSQFALQKKFKAIISYHSYSELILYPWGYTSSPCPDDTKFRKYANDMASLNGYTPMQASSLYVAHGTEVDWFYNNVSAFSFVFELDKSFSPPANQIPKTCAKNREASFYLLKHFKGGIHDVGIWKIISPLNNSLLDVEKECNISVEVMNYGNFEEYVNVIAEIKGLEGKHNENVVENVHLMPGEIKSVNLKWRPPFYGDEKYEITVKCRISDDTSSENDESRLIVRTRAVYGAEISIESSVVKLYPSQSYILNGTVKNIGNRDDTIIMKVHGANTEYIKYENVYEIKSNESTKFSIDIYIPSDANPDEHLYTISAESSTGRGKRCIVNFTLLILSPYPVADAGEDLIVNVSQEITFSAENSITPIGDIISYIWDFGDETMAEGKVVKHEYEKRGVYIVNLTIENSLGYKDRDSINVTVIQTFKIHLKVNDTINVLPGMNTFELCIINEGNGKDSLDLWIEVSDERWDVEIYENHIELYANELKKINITVDVPQFETAKNSTTFAVYAKSIESKSSYVVYGKFIVSEMRNISYNVDRRIIDMKPGEKKKIIASFENFGNVMEEINDAIFHNAYRKIIEISMSDFKLYPGEKKDVYVEVIVHDRALNGTYEFTILNITVFVNVIKVVSFDIKIRQKYLDVEADDEFYIVGDVVSMCNYDCNISIHVSEPFKIISLNDLEIPAYSKEEFNITLKSPNEKGKLILVITFKLDDKKIHEEKVEINVIKEDNVVDMTQPFISGEGYDFNTIIIYIFIGIIACISSLVVYIAFRRKT